MRFLVITHVPHKIQDTQVFAYGPYTKEMNIWFKHVVEVKVIGPITSKVIEPIDLAYQHNCLDLIAVPAFNITSVVETVKTLFKLPILAYQVVRAMFWADHIHLRCPGNMGLIGAVAQVFFPHKHKTAKYAGNWDPQSTQPRSYKLQRWLLSNTILSQNMTVLVYGDWPNQSKNIMPFFTASYHQYEKQPVIKLLPIANQNALGESNDSCPLNFLYVGTLSASKRPMLAVQVIQALISDGIYAQLDILGEGSERTELEKYIRQHQLESYIILHGNQNSETVISYFNKAHFLIFMSKSEGWPKVVAEAMFWGCVPITTAVSCVDFMIGYGQRGKISEPDINSIIKWIKYYLEQPEEYEQNATQAIAWSRQFTLEYFEQEIGRLLNVK